MDDLSSLLRKRIVEDSAVSAPFAALEPPFEGYQHTLEALRAYMQAARADDGEILPSTSKAVDPGSLYPGTARLSRFLRLLGDLPADASPAVERYQGAIVDAVKHFQKRHGLE